MLQKENKAVNNVFEFKIDDGLLVRRISGRRIHEASGRVYHIEFNPPKVEGKDDVSYTLMGALYRSTLVLSFLKGYRRGSFATP